MVDLRSGFALHLQAEGDVLRNREVGKQRIRLKNCVDRSFMGRELVDAS
ncbi:hypothetical protein ADILRU_2348 [Leifsonia rubra CMS 76R]|nr:hypothetical protein ADILRU_2348 [Leifsonia rubra CMS 76R]